MGGMKWDMKAFNMLDTNGSGDFNFVEYLLGWYPSLEPVSLLPMIQRWGVPHNPGLEEPTPQMMEALKTLEAYNTEMAVHVIDSSPDSSQRMATQWKEAHQSVRALLQQERQKWQALINAEAEQRHALFCDEDTQWAALWGYFWTACAAIESRIKEAVVGDDSDEGRIMQHQILADLKQQLVLMLTQERVHRGPITWEYDSNWDLIVQDFGHGMRAIRLKELQAVEAQSRGRIAAEARAATEALFVTCLQIVQIMGDVEGALQEEERAASWEGGLGYERRTLTDGDGREEQTGAEIEKVEAWAEREYRRWEGERLRGEGGGAAALVAAHKTGARQECALSRLIEQEGEERDELEDNEDLDWSVLGLRVQRILQRVKAEEEVRQSLQAEESRRWQMRLDLMGERVNKKESPPRQWLAGVEAKARQQLEQRMHDESPLSSPPASPKNTAEVACNSEERQLPPVNLLDAFGAVSRGDAEADGTQPRDGVVEEETHPMGQGVDLGLEAGARTARATLTTKSSEKKPRPWLSWLSRNRSAGAGQAASARPRLAGIVHSTKAGTAVKDPGDKGDVLRGQKGHATSSDDGVTVNELRQDGQDDVQEWQAWGEKCVESERRVWGEMHKVSTNGAALSWQTRQETVQGTGRWTEVRSGERSGKRTEEVIGAKTGKWTEEGNEKGTIRRTEEVGGDGSGNGIEEENVKRTSKCAEEGSSKWTEEHSGKGTSMRTEERSGAETRTWTEGVGGKRTGKCTEEGSGMGSGRCTQAEGGEGASRCTEETSGANSGSWTEERSGAKTGMCTQERSGMVAGQCTQEEKGAIRRTEEASRGETGRSTKEISGKSTGKCTEEDSGMGSGRGTEVGSGKRTGMCTEEENEKGTVSRTEDRSAMGTGTWAEEEDSVETGKPTEYVSGKSTGKGTEEVSGMQSGRLTEAESGQESGMCTGEVSGMGSGTGTAAESGQESGMWTGEVSGMGSGRGTAAENGQECGMWTGEVSQMGSGRGTAAESGQESGMWTAEVSGMASGRGTAAESGQESGMWTGEVSGMASGRGTAAESGQESGMWTGEVSGMASGRGTAAESGKESGMWTGEVSGMASGRGTAAESGKAAGMCTEEENEKGTLRRTEGGRRADTGICTEEVSRNSTEEDSARQSGRWPDTQRGKRTGMWTGEESQAETDCWTEKYLEAAQDLQGIRQGHGAGEIRDTKGRGAEDTKGVQGMWSKYPTDGPKGSSGSEGTEGTEKTEGLQGTQGRAGSHGTEGKDRTEGPKVTQGTTSATAADGKDPPTRASSLTWTRDDSTSKSWILVPASQRELHAGGAAQRLAAVGIHATIDPHPDPPDGAGGNGQPHAENAAERGFQGAAPVAKGGSGAPAAGEDEVTVEEAEVYERHARHWAQRVQAGLSQIELLCCEEEATAATLEAASTRLQQLLSFQDKSLMELHEDMYSLHGLWCRTQHKWVQRLGIRWTPLPDVPCGDKLEGLLQRVENATAMALQTSLARVHSLQKVLLREYAAQSSALHAWLRSKGRQVLEVSDVEGPPGESPALYATAVAQLRAIESEVADCDVPETVQALADRLHRNDVPFVAAPEPILHPWEQLEADLRHLQGVITGRVDMLQAFAGAA